VLEESKQLAVLGNGPVIGLRWIRDIDYLKKPTRLQRIERIPKMTRPARYYSGINAAMHQIEDIVSPSPFIVKVVNLERDVGRHPRGLDLGQISPNDASGGILVAHLHTPDPGACAQVENAIWTVPNGGEMQASVHDELEPVVYRVFAVHFLFVVGLVLIACFVGVVAAAVLKGLSIGERSRKEGWSLRAYICWDARTQTRQ
jgi:hypothetical protein